LAARKFRAESRAGETVASDLGGGSENLVNHLRGTGAGFVKVVDGASGGLVGSSITVGGGKRTEFISKRLLGGEGGKIGTRLQEEKRYVAG